MTHNISDDILHDKLTTIEQVLEGIEKGGGAVHLRDLSSLLIHVMGMVERDPGLEAAADDLYAAAHGVVRDSHVDAQPLARKLRLLRDSRQRFRNRLFGAVERSAASQRKVHVTSSILCAA